jgi:hypothetical protein
MAEHSNEEQLELQFEADLMALYEEAKSRFRLPAQHFKQMIPRHGAVDTVRRLLYDPKIQSGFTDLVLCGCRELSVEALALQPEYRGLFMEAQLARAHERIHGD